VARRRRRPRLTEPEKEAAEDQLSACKDAEATFAVAAAAAGTAAFAAGVAAPYAVVAMLLVALMRRHTRKVERAVEDPPRRDFATSTRAQRPRIDPRKALGASPLEEVAVPALESLREVTAYMSALVRAIERAQTAEQIGAEELQLRLAEASENAERFSAAAPTLESAFVVLAGAMEEPGPLLPEDFWRFSRGRFELRRPHTFLEILTPETKNALRRAGVSEADLRRKVPPALPRDPFGDAARALVASGRSIHRFGEVMGHSQSR
jgi:hypothetical protein